ncbi:thyroid receptor-interacting protein 6 isoform X2 [Onthophagus taurus]|uniref:thyroid receptor-interacting protein 6 isoform X2 n=1 Tax=Onthophagus taurus TaxID=166361 RepID=UPI000C20A74D|nr:thyroid receptor-interacting protein 6 isoform X2 [Onthophagus taurus]
MDDLDKQLAELQLINNAELPPNPSTLQKQSTPGKKIAPTVPPKPKKQQPLVPHSYSIQQNLEPSYSSRLHSPGGANFYSNITQNVQHSKTPSNSSTLPLGTSMSQSSLYGNSSDHYANILGMEPGSGQYSNLPPPPPPITPAQSQTGSVSGSVRGSPQTVSTSGFGNTNFVPKGYNKKPEQVTYSNVQVGGFRGGERSIYSNVQGVYNNVGSLYANGEDLPPPPPPVQPSNLPEYTPCTVNTNFPPPPDDFPPPPSPVSSSYSELRRATQPSQDYNNYGMGSSSTYESIYEPINPRPSSQMSSRSNYSLYAPYSGSSSHMSGPSQSASRIGNNKEHEVDTLTDLLVQGMVGESEGGEFYGICVKCREKVIGENNGCTAMDKIYHTKCFTCNACAINLQGKPFYALRGKPYCKEDYMNTLEKCSVCTKPILDRILRATGKPYHPKCFCCVICGKSLDGIPFTVDATNQIHCIEDFHKKFAPKCCVCNFPIMPEPGQDETVRVVALDRSFHIQCYKCEDCGLVLSSEAEGRGCYPLDDHVLCKSCNAKRVQALTNNITTEL